MFLFVLGLNCVVFDLDWLRWCVWFGYWVCFGFEFGFSVCYAVGCFCCFVCFYVGCFGGLGLITDVG